jgi:Regulator of G protein signaling domain
MIVSDAFAKSFFRPFLESECGEKSLLFIDTTEELASSGEEISEEDFAERTKYISSSFITAGGSNQIIIAQLLQRRILAAVKQQIDRAYILSLFAEAVKELIGTLAGVMPRYELSTFYEDWVAAETSQALERVRLESTKDTILIVQDDWLLLGIMRR